MRLNTKNLVVVAFLTVSAASCGDKDDPAPAAGPDGGLSNPVDGMPVTPPPAPGAARVTPTQGAAIAVTRDDKYAVATNRTAGRVTVFKLELGTANAATRVVDLDVGANSEPWAVVIGNDDDSAFVILRNEKRVVRIKGLRSTPSVDTLRADTGSEPTGIAISPTGARLYVANWAEGTVSSIDSTTMTVTAIIDLNGALAASGLLGPGVTSRPALAHPRSLVVTNNGNNDDSDETVFVTEFFSQARMGPLPTDDSQFDVGRQGVVYAFSTVDRTVRPLITIAPVANTGFVDSKGGTTGCFPNQLYAAAINNQRLYVTALCESPRGPIGPDAAPVAPGVGTSNFKTQIHAAVFVIDIATRAEVPAQGVLLTREFDRLYAAMNLPDDASRRLPLIPNDIMFAAGTSIGYVSSYGSDAVFRISYRADGTLERVGAIAQPFIDLKPAGGNIAPGELPIGIASANAGASTVPFALALNESTRNLSIMNFATQTVVSAVPATNAAGPGEATAVNRGRKFFVTGLGRWSLNGQGWNSCEACHPDGLTDNVTWFFARGPRQSTSLDGTYDSSGRRRVLNWSGILDEVQDFELNTRGNSGGVGAIVHRSGPPIAAADRIIFDGTMPVADQRPTMTPQAGLNGSTGSLMPGKATMPNSTLNDWDEIDAYAKTVRAPRAPVGLDAAAVATGKRIFDANNCAGCHGGSLWTMSTVFYTPNEINNADAGLLRMTQYTRPAAFPQALNPPSVSGSASLRFTGMNPAANDQINCVLRDVGTFPGVGTVGVSPAGVVIKEVRQDMTTPAQGLTGFSIPSLLGMGTGAPFFHNGSARTLEEAFGDVFDRHRRSFSENFRIDANEARALVSYVLSIDETTPAPSQTSLGFAVDLCAQTPAGVIR